MRKCPLITGCPLIAVSLEDRFYCNLFIFDENILWHYHLDDHKALIYSHKYEQKPHSSCTLAL